MSDRSLVDWSRTAGLGDGWHAAVAVEPDGSWWPWLLSPDGPDPEAPDVVTPTHEDLGPLPVAVLRVIERCGAATQAGTPCTRRAGPSGRCTQHARMAGRP